MKNNYSWEMAGMIKVKGGLLALDEPLVMGILNVTDDSFYEGSRLASPAALVARAQSMLDDGAAILDVGGCSTRPGAMPVEPGVELARLHAALDALDDALPGAVVSLDTFRGDVARECVARHNVSMLNDVSGFAWDAGMFDAVVELGLPYVLTHSVGFAGEAALGNECLPQVIEELASKLWLLRQAGVKDVIVDPGFGFGKDLRLNYRMLALLCSFEVLEAPLLVGLSRKSMIINLLGLKADDALAATTALNLVAAMNGASILRVHDVKEAVQAIRLAKALKKEE